VPFRALHPLARARALRTMADRSGADRYAFDVLTALALRMDEDGRAEVGQVRLAREARCSERTARSRLAWLARAGLLIRRRSGPRGLYRYQLACPTPDVLDAPTAARLQTGTDDGPTLIWCVVEEVPAAEVSADRPPAAPPAAGPAPAVAPPARPAPRPPAPPRTAADVAAAPDRPPAVQTGTAPAPRAARPARWGAAKGFREEIQRRAPDRRRVDPTPVRAPVRQAAQTGTVQGTGAPSAGAAPTPRRPGPTERAAVLAMVRAWLADHQPTLPGVPLTATSPRLPGDRPAPGG
jgi:hypothetical protein